MTIDQINNYTRGWIVGDFSPALVRSKEIECAVMSYKKNESTARHVHRVTKEFTMALSGKFLLNGTVLSPGQIAIISPGEYADFTCLEAGSTLVIKTPSVPGDKYYE